MIGIFLVLIVGLLVSFATGNKIFHANSVSNKQTNKFFMLLRDEGVRLSPEGVKLGPVGGQSETRRGQTKIRRGSD